MLKVSAFMRMRSVGELHAHVERALTVTSLVTVSGPDLQVFILKRGL